MKIAALVEALVATGATPETILAAVRVAEEQKDAAIDASREKARARVAKWRDKQASNVTERLVTSRNGLRGGVTRVEDKTSTQRIEPQEQEDRKKRATSALSPEFDEFWSVFPNKVGKPAAARAFVKALSRASFATIMAGLRAYIAGTPVDRAWLNPATFLNNDRWADQPAIVVPMARAGPSTPVPSQADVFRFAGQRSSDERQEREDSSGFRAALSHLRPAGSG